MKLSDCTLCIFLWFKNTPNGSLFRITQEIENQIKICTKAQSGFFIDQIHIRFNGFDKITNYYATKIMHALESKVNIM